MIEAGRGVEALDAWGVQEFQFVAYTAKCHETLGRLGALPYGLAEL
jgi:hypothetical protein